MARTLNAKHEEIPQTSPLFNAFLFLAILVMVLGTLASGNANANGSNDSSIVIHNQ